MSRYSPPSISPPPSPPEGWWGNQGSPEYSYTDNYPSPQQWAVGRVPTPDGSPPVVGFEVVRHNYADRNQENLAQNYPDFEEQLRQQNEGPGPAAEFIVHTGMAWQVHNVFENIKENYEKIIHEFGGRVYLDILTSVGPDELINGLDLFFAEIISKRDNTPLRDGPEYTKIKKILNRLWLAKQEYLDSHFRNEIFTWFQFVMRQPNSFQFQYVTCFIEDTFFAYDNGDTLSCVKGIRERLLLSIADACVLYCTQYKKKHKPKTKNTKKKKTIARRLKQKTAKKLATLARLQMNQTMGGAVSEFKKCDNPTYRRLIRLFKKEVPDMNELTKEWAVIFTGGLADSLTTKQIKDEFIDFMERKYTLYGIDNSVAIQIRADSFDDIFERREF